MTSSTDLILSKLTSENKETSSDANNNVLAETAVIPAPLKTLSPSMEEILSNCLSSTKEKKLVKGS